MKYFFILLLTFSFFEKVSAAPDQLPKGPWHEYFQSQINARPHDLVTKAFELLKKKKNARVIDLGAGNGKDIANILKAGAVVYAYDADPESVNLIDKRFKYYIKSNKLFIHQMFFEDMKALPKADMVIALHSLPFMKQDKFLRLWQITQEALVPGGIFVGTFFGEKHYAKRNPNQPKLFRLSREEVLNLFKNFKILNFYEEVEYDEASSKSWGTDQFDHRYKVIARKRG